MFNRCKDRGYLKNKKPQLIFISFRGHSPVDFRSLIHLTQTSSLRFKLTGLGIWEPLGFGPIKLGNYLHQSNRMYCLVLSVGKYT